MPSIPLSKMDSALTLAEAAKKIPGRPSKDTLRRWIYKGLQSGAKLDAFKIGGVIYHDRGSDRAILRRP